MGDSWGIRGLEKYFVVSQNEDKHALSDLQQVTREILNITLDS